MKVALVRGPQLSPFEMQTYAPLAGMGFDLTAFTSRTPMFDEPLEMPVVRLASPADAIARSRGPLRVAREAWAYRRGVTNRLEGLEDALAGYDVLHPMETFNAFTVQCLDAGQSARIPTVVTVWENIPFLPLEAAFERHRERVLREADAFVAITERAKAALLLEGAPEERIHVIPVGIDLERFRPQPADPQIRRSLGIPEGSFVLLFAARLTWEKGLLDVLHAMKLLAHQKRAGADAHLVVLGDGDQADETRARVRQLGLQDRVHFAGTVPYAQMHAWFQASDAFVLGSRATPRWQEQYGMVLVEAMACGLPVVVAASGSIPEVVGEAAITYQSADPLTLADALERVQDPATRRDMARRGRERTEHHHDRQRVAERLATLYRQLAGGGGP